MDKQQRPLSPHLQVYRPQLTSVLSILHRLTGITLSACLILLVGWLYALSQGEASYHQLQLFLQSRYGILFLFILSWVLLYHLFNGIRHLLWDAGIGLELKSVYISGYLTITASLLVTLLLWWAR